MIEASKLKAGMTFESEGKLIRVLEASHHKPGKGNTIMRMKLRDVRTGSTFDTTYRPDEKFEQAIIETVPAQYLYKMDDTAYFMNTDAISTKFQLLTLSKSCFTFLKTQTLKSNSMEAK